MKNGHEIATRGLPCPSLLPLLLILLAGTLAGCAPLRTAGSGTGLDSSEPPHPIRPEDQRRIEEGEARRAHNPWFVAGRQSVAEIAASLPSTAPARNVILFVGDGMGVSTVTAARILEGQRRGDPGEENRLSFETLPHLALSKTYSTNAQVSDSAATITAMVTGAKTRSGVIGLSATAADSAADAPGAALLTILEEAESRGLATGVVTTTTLTHATPAGAYAHVPRRSWENDAKLPEAARAAGFPDIARQFVEFPYGDGIDVALGGGRRHFQPKDTADPEQADKQGSRLDGRDLIRAWTEQRPGAAYVWNQPQLDALQLDGVSALLGLFEAKHMQWEADRAQDTAGEPSLAEMTQVAIDLLSREEKGFFLLVEAGRIDHAHHAGNAYRALTDTIALSDAVRAAMNQTRAEETLIVVTADHSHTFMMSGYPGRGNPILGLVRSEGFFAAGGQSDLSRDALGLPYTTLSYANGPGYSGGSASQPEGPHSFGHRPCESHSPPRCSAAGIEKGRPDLSEVDTEDPNYLQEATVPLSSETHAGEDVPIYAGGPRAALFRGVQEQNYIYHAMVEAFGWTRFGQPVPRPVP